MLMSKANQVDVKDSRDLNIVFSTSNGAIYMLYTYLELSQIYRCRLYKVETDRISFSFLATEPADLPVSVHFHFRPTLVLTVSFQLRFRPKPRLRFWNSQKRQDVFIFTPQHLFLAHNIRFVGFNY